MTQELATYNVLGGETELSFTPDNETAAMLDSVTAFAATAKSLVVADAASFAGANESLREVATLAKALDTRRKVRTKPIDDLKKEIMDYFRKGDEALTGARAALSQQTQAWTRKQQEIQREQQRKANEAAEKERRRIAKLAVKAEERGDIDRAIAHSERAAMVQAPIIAQAPTKAEGVSTRTYWRFEVTDPMQLLPLYLLPNEPMIQKLVDALHENAPQSLPGIRVWSEERVVVRGR